MLCVSVKWKRCTSSLTPRFVLLCSHISLCIVPSHQAPEENHALRMIDKEVFPVDITLCSKKYQMNVVWLSHSVLAYRIVRTVGCLVVVYQWSEYWQLKPEPFGLILSDCWFYQCSVACHLATMITISAMHGVVFICREMKKDLNQKRLVSSVPGLEVRS